MWGGAKSRVHCYHELFNKAGLIPGEGSEKSLSPPIPVCGGAVVTNDWCITYNR